MKTRLKQFSAWALTIVVLISLVLSPMAVAAPTTVTVDNVRQQIEQAAWVHLVAQKFQACIGYGDDGHGSISSTGISSSTAKTGNFFAGTTNVLSGAYLENKIQGKVQNGEIWCSNDDSANITQLFAQAIGVSVNDIICNKKDPYYGGLLAPAEYDSTSGSYYGGGYRYVLGENKNCSNASTYLYNTNDPVFNRDASKDIYGGDTYIKQLYDEYKSGANNPYLLDFDSLGNYDKIDGYYLYLNDFKTACSGSIFKEEYDGQLKHDDLYFSIKTVNDKGEIGTVYYNRNGKTDNSNSHSSFVDGGPTTCGALVDKINTYAEEFQEKIQTEIKNQCKTALAGAVDEKITQNQEIINNAESSEEAKAEAQSKLDELKNIKSSGNYTSATDAGGLQCVDVPDVIVDVEDYTDPVAGENGPTSDPCYSGDIESMSWILCPAQSNLTKTTDGLLGWIDQWLEVKTDLYDSNSGAHEAWAAFRDIANVLIIVVLLVVIFSQLTGVGIDNYGIKKILPRLIAMAILINLSFIICQVLVDLSNILGTSLNQLFQIIAQRMPGYSKAESVTVSDIVGSFIAVAGGAAAGVGALASGITLVAGAGASGVGLIVIIAVLVLLIVVVSVTMFFASLAARILIITLFIGLAPLACACYILPNTQILFKKWWNVFKAALLVYPICGAMYGLSFVVRAIAFSSPQLEFPMAMVALIASFMPWLILPSLLKKTLSGLGMVGEKLAGIGNSLKRGYQSGLNAAKGTEAYKRGQNFGRNRIQGGLDNRARRRLEGRQDRALNEAERSKMQGFRQRIRSGEELKGQDLKDYNKLNEKIDSSKYKLSDARAARLASINQADTKRRLERENNRFASDALIAEGVYRQQSAQQANGAGNAERHAETNAEELRTAARQNAFTDAGSQINSTLGKADAIRTFESEYGVGSAETSRLAAAIKSGQQLKDTVSANQAADRLKDTNISREAILGNLPENGSLPPSSELAAVSRAAKAGNLASIINDTTGAYTNGQRELARKLQDATGASLAGKSSQDILTAMRGVSGVSSNNALAPVLAAAMAGSLSYITSNTNGTFSQGQIDFANALSSSGTNFTGKSLQEIANLVGVDDKLAAAAARVAGPAFTAAMPSLATLGQTTAQLTQAVDTGTNKLSNQYELESATNAVGEIRISHERATSLARERQDAARFKEHAEEFARQTRGDVKKVLASEIINSNADTNRVGAALKDIYDKGGVEDIMSVVYNSNITDPFVRKTVSDFMATMSEPIAKQYGKYVAAGGSGSFKEFVEGTAAPRADGGVSSLGAYLAPLGDNGFNTANKDAIKFILGTNNSGVLNAISSPQIANLAFAAKGEDRQYALQLLQKRCTTDRSGILKSFSDTQWSQMSIDMVEAIAGSSSMSGSPVAGDLAAIKNRIQTNPRLKQNLKPEVRTFFGIA